MERSQVQENWGSNTQARTPGWKGKREDGWPCQLSTELESEVKLAGAQGSLAGSYGATVRTVVLSEADAAAGTSCHELLRCMPLLLLRPSFLIMSVVFC